MIPVNGVALDGLPVKSHRRLVVTLTGKNHPQIVIRPGISRVQIDCLLVGLDCLSLMPQRVVYFPQVVPGQRPILIVYMPLDGVLVEGQGLLVPFLFGIDESQVVIGPGITRVKFDRPLVSLNRLLTTFQNAET